MSGALQYLPRTEGDLRAYCRTFDEKINASPADFDVTPVQAAQYTILRATFSDLYQQANQSSTRTPLVISLKNKAKAALIAETRTLAAHIRSSTNVSTDNKVAIGLHVGGERVAAIPRPETPPSILIENSVGRTVTIRLRDADSTSRRGRPANAIGALLFSSVGDSARRSLTDWQFQGITNKTRAQIHFDADVPPGSQVWVTAQWVGTRMETGDIAQPQPTRIPGGLVQAT